MLVFPAIAGIEKIILTQNPAFAGWSNRNVQPTEFAFMDRLELSALPSVVKQKSNIQEED